MEIEVTGNLLFVNVGELSQAFLNKRNHQPTAERKWENSCVHGFISAGQGAKFRNQIMTVKVGDIICAYLNEKGFVGIGKCVAEFAPHSNSFVRNINFIHQTNLHLNSGDLDLQEYVIKIDWFKETLRDRNNAENFGRGITSQIVCNLSDAKKEFIEERFNVKFLRQ